MQVRAGLAQLGYKTLDDFIGRPDLLRQRPVKLSKTSHLDLSFLTTFPGPAGRSADRIAQARS